MTVISSGGTTCTSPRRNRAAPTPPASAASTLANVPVSTREPAPEDRGPVRRGELRWSGGPIHELLGPARAGADRPLHLGGRGLELLDDRLHPLAHAPHEGLDPTRDVLAGRARVGANVVGEGPRLGPAGLGPGLWPGCSL